MNLHRVVFDIAFFKEPVYLPCLALCRLMKDTQYRKISLLRAAAYDTLSQVKLRRIGKPLRKQLVSGMPGFLLLRSLRLTVRFSTR